MDVIKEACDRGVVIVTISQCAKGSVSIDYAAGKSLADAGVTAGADMTPEVDISPLGSSRSTHACEIYRLRWRSSLTCFPSLS